MAEVIIPIMTLAPRVPQGRQIVTITTNAGVTVFVTDEVTVYITDTVEKTVSIFDTSFIHTTTTITDTSTITKPTTITETQTLTPSPALPTITEKETTRPISIPGTIKSTTSLLPLPTPFCTTPPAHAPAGKHVDPFQVLSIVFGVFILSLLALMWFLVIRFYKMYRAERVLRKQIQTEGTEMPVMRMAVNEGETHVVGEE